MYDPLLVSQGAAGRSEPSLSPATDISTILAMDCLYPMSANCRSVPQGSDNFGEWKVQDFNGLVPWIWHIYPGVRSSPAPLQYQCELATGSRSPRSFFTDGVSRTAQGPYQPKRQQTSNVTAWPTIHGMSNTSNWQCVWTSQAFLAVG